MHIAQDLHPDGHPFAPPFDPPYSNEKSYVYVCVYMYICVYVYICKIVICKIITLSVTSFNLIICMYACMSVYIE